MPMIKKYLYLTLCVLFFSVASQAQENKSAFDNGNKQEQPAIEGLSIYPNPTNTGKIYISSKSSAEKRIEIFNVLGKKVLETVVTSKEVNISNLSPGVYIIKIKEGEISATRKLIIN